MKMLGTKQFLEYLIPKIGLERALKLNERTVYSYTRRENLEPKILPAVVQLTKEYDIGVAIASKGLILGYYFDLRGFPIKVVNQKRKGKGATWNPIDNLEDLTDKNVLLLESDIITGRSAKRAERELQKFKPKLIDLLLLFETVPISVGDYERTQKFLPQPEKILQSRFTPNVKILSAEFNNLTQELGKYHVTYG